MSSGREWVGEFAPQIPVNPTKEPISKQKAPIPSERRLDIGSADVTLSYHQKPAVAWEILHFYFKYDNNWKAISRGKKPNQFGKKPPTKREWKHYLSLQQVKNPIHEARRYQQIYELPSVQTYAQVATHFGVSRARVCQILNLLKLREEIINYLDNTPNLPPITERKLRPLTVMNDQEEQIEGFNELLLTLT